MSFENRKRINLTDGTYLDYYYAQDSHGSCTENYTHKASDGTLISLYCETERRGKAEKLQYLLTLEIKPTKRLSNGSKTILN